MRIGIAQELDQTEPRIGATPDTIKRMREFGAEVVVQRGAGGVRDTRC
jgi:NAD(P) transhydrogenase subunit alpha